MLFFPNNRLKVNGIKMYCYKLLKKKKTQKMLIWIYKRIKYEFSIKCQREVECVRKTWTISENINNISALA